MSDLWNRWTVTAATLLPPLPQRGWGPMLPLAAAWGLWRRDRLQPAPLAWGSVLTSVPAPFHQMPQAVQRRSDPIVLPVTTASPSRVLTGALTGLGKLEQWLSRIDQRLIGLSHQMHLPERVIQRSGRRGGATLLPRLWGDGNERGQPARAIAPPLISVTGGELSAGRGTVVPWLERPVSASTALTPPLPSVMAGQRRPAIAPLLQPPPPGMLAIPVPTEGSLAALPAIGPPVLPSDHSPGAPPVGPEIRREAPSRTVIFEPRWLPPPGAPEIFPVGRSGSGWGIAPTAAGVGEAFRLSLPGAIAPPSRDWGPIALQPRVFAHSALMAALPTPLPGAPLLTQVSGLGNAPAFSGPIAQAPLLSMVSAGGEESSRLAQLSQSLVWSTRRDRAVALSSQAPSWYAIAPPLPVRSAVTPLSVPLVQRTTVPEPLSRPQPAAPAATAAPTDPAPVQFNGGIQVQVTAHTLDLDHAEETARQIAERVRQEINRLTAQDRVRRGLPPYPRH